MKLQSLLAPWVSITQDQEILEVQHDSRKMGANTLFLAYPGHVLDGRSYIAEALKKGAVAVCYDPEGLSLDQAKQLEDSCCHPIPALSHQAAYIFARFYGDPSRHLVTIGVTGTNGKTTVAYLLAQAYENMGLPSAYIGTLGLGAISALKESANTTPDPLILQRFFHECVYQKIKMIAMEVSSHALDQGRVAGIDFHQAIFTNLTLDHLDYHQTMEQYACAKAKLFAWPTLKQVIVNADDSYCSQMLKSVLPSVNVIRYSLREASADVYASEIIFSMKGLSFKVHTPWGETFIESTLMGEFNLYNLLAVITSLGASGYRLCDISNVIKQLKPAPGRLEIVHDDPCVVVDYAHTPDALKKALMTLKKLTEGKLWVVFGCGGDRDRSKRPLMGQIAMELADVMVVTSDNPRTEDPLTIIQEMIQGIDPACYYLEEDRQKAIEYALSHADSKDMVLIAGKGHESYQCIGHEKFFFSDQDVVVRFFSSIRV